MAITGSGADNVNAASDFQGFPRPAPTVLANLANNNEKARIYINRADDEGRLSASSRPLSRRVGRTLPIVAALHLPAALEYCAGAYENMAPVIQRTLRTAECGRMCEPGIAGPDAGSGYG